MRDVALCPAHSIPGIYILRTTIKYFKTCAENFTEKCCTNPNGLVMFTAVIATALFCSSNSNKYRPCRGGRAGGTSSYLRRLFFYSKYVSLCADYHMQKPVSIFVSGTGVKVASPSLATCHVWNTNFCKMMGMCQM